MVVRYLWRQTKIKTNTLENVIKDLIPDSVNKDDLEIIIICKDKKKQNQYKKQWTSLSPIIITFSTFGLKHYYIIY